MLDIGSYHIRGGYSGEDTPRMSTPSLVGTIEQEDKNSYYVDDMVNIYKDGMNIVPITDINSCSTFI